MSKAPGVGVERLLLFIATLAWVPQICIGLYNSTSTGCVYVCQLLSAAVKYEYMSGLTCVC